jgi:hypothetical protein
MLLAKKKNDIISLIEQVYDEFLLSDISCCIVPSSIPIIWFGDIKSFLNSETKIITVSLNPSNNEFGNSKKNIPYSTHFRFPDYDGSIDSLIVAYDNYFKRGNNPYNTWFKASFGSVLKGFEASYYEGAVNTALHTDIAIPYATEPTWNGLSKAEKGYFEPIGQKIWHDLVNILEPDIILISASGGFQNKILFPKIHENWKVIIQKEKFPVLFNQFKVKNKITDIIFQTQGRKPFLNMTREEKLNLKNTFELHKNGKA